MSRNSDFCSICQGTGVTTYWCHEEPHTETCECQRPQLDTLPVCPDCNARFELVRPGKVQPTCLCEAHRVECLNHEESRRLLDQSRADNRRLLDLLRKAASVIPTGVTACHGDKCRMQSCESCYGDEALTNDPLLAEIVTELEGQTGARRERNYEGAACRLALAVDQYVKARMGDDLMERMARFEDLHDARKRFTIAEKALQA